MSSLIGNNMLVGSASYVPPYTIDNSVRINDDDSAFLSKAYVSSGIGKLGLILFGPNVVK